MEEKLAAGLGEGQISQFVHDDEVEPGDEVGEPSLLAIARLRLEPVDEIDDVVETPARAVADQGAEKRIGDGKDGGRLWVTLAGQDVDDDGGGEDAMLERLLAGRLDDGKAVDADTFEDRYHLPVAVMHGLELSAHLLHGGRQNPVVERSTIPQGSRLRARTGT